MYVRQFRANVGSRIGALLVGALLVLAAGVFLTFGFLLIVGLAAVGLVIGIGAALFRRLGGGLRGGAPHRETFTELDPAMEVLAPPQTAERQAVERAEPKHHG